MFSDIYKRLKNAEWIHIFVNHPIYGIISVNSVRDLKITTRKPGYLYHHCVQQPKDRNYSKNWSKIAIIFGIKRSVFAHPKLLRFAHSILLSPKCNVIIQV